MYFLKSHFLTLSLKEGEVEWDGKEKIESIYVSKEVEVNFLW